LLSLLSLSTLAVSPGDGSELGLVGVEEAGGEILERREGGREEKEEREEGF
jgi:hypothetical protein